MCEKQLTQLETELALYGYHVGQKVKLSQCECEFKIVDKQNGQLILEPIEVPLNWIQFNDESEEITHTFIENNKIVTRKSL